MWGMMFWIWGFGALLTVGIIYAVLWLVRQSERSAGRDESTGPKDEEPQKILDRRYARGELGREEYERMRRELSAR